MTRHSSSRSQRGLLLLAALAALACKAKPNTTSPPNPTSTPVASAPAGSASAGANGPLKTCAECESASACSELMTGCAKFAGEDAKRCEAVKECVQRTGCGQGKNTFTSCYCGELGTAKCLETPLEGAGAPAGACREPIKLAYGGVANTTQLLTRYIEPEFPGGAALARLNCLKLNCSRECSFDKDAPAKPGPATPK